MRLRHQQPVKREAITITLTRKQVLMLAMAAQYQLEDDDALAPGSLRSLRTAREKLTQAYRSEPGGK